MKKDNRKNAILIGDEKHAVYHPYKALEEVLQPLVDGFLTITGTEEIEILKSEELFSFDLCIFYIDVNRGKLSNAQLAGLVSYIAKGGKFLCIHSGLILENYEFLQLVGASFEGHPPYQPLTYRVVADHPITSGIEDFHFEEELYELALSNFCPREVLIECTNGEVTMPAVWCHTFGKGKVVYVAPGHDKRTFQEPSYQQLLVQSAKWLIEV